MSKAGKADQAAAREERLSAALRENLKRRKAQARARAAAVVSGVEPANGAKQIAPKTPDFRRNQGSE